MNRMFVIAISICLCSLLVGVSAQEEKNTATTGVKTDTIPGEWELKPLAVEGSPVPGIGGSGQLSKVDPSQYHERGVSIISPDRTVYPAYRDPAIYDFASPSYAWTQSGMLAFWANYGTTGSALLSIKDGKVTKILLKGEPLPVSGSYKAMVQPVPPVYVLVPTLLPGKNLLYINAMSHPFSGKMAVYTWDGETLKLLLGGDSDLEVDGVTYRLFSASAVGIASDGRAIVDCLVKKPLKGFAFFHDGTKLIPLRLWELEKPLPGMPEVTVVSSVQFRLFDGGAVAVLKVKGASYKEALFRKTPEKTEKILAIGDPDPFDPARKIQSIALFAADKNNVAFVVINDARNVAPVLLLFRNGKFQKLFDSTLPGVKDKPPWRQYRIGDGFFLDPESPNYFFRVTLSRELSKSERANHSTYELFPHYFFFDGENLNDLSESAETTQLTSAIPLNQLGKGAFDRRGVIFRGVSAKGLRVFDNAVQFETEAPGTSWLLDISGNEFSFKPAPEFNIHGRKISLGNVVGWRSPTEAIVRLDDGIYLLSKVR